MRYFKNDTGNVYTNGTDKPNHPSHKEVSPEGIEAQKQKDSQNEYVEKIKKALISHFDDITKEEMVEFTAAFNEYKELGQVKLDRYPLVTAQIQEWTEQGIL